MEIFEALCWTIQLEIIQGGKVQPETATVMMMFDEDLQMTSKPLTDKLLILFCHAVQWKNNHRAPAQLESWLDVTNPQTMEKHHDVGRTEQ